MFYSSPSRYLPRIIQASVFVLVALVAWNLARLSVVLLHAMRPATTPAVLAHGGIHKPVESSAQRLLRSHLFGPSAITNNAPETSLALTLQGTYAQGKGQGYAIISPHGGKANVYTPGNTLPGNVRLKAVYANRVLLATTSGEESLRLIKPKSGGLSLTESPPLRKVKARHPSPSKRPKSASHNPFGLSKLVRTTPIRVGGRFAGYRVDPGTNPALFIRLGLQPGDVVTSVNGLSLNTPGGALAAMHGLRNPQNISLVVERNGHQITLHPGRH